MKNATQIAVRYCYLSGRSTLTSTDIEFAFKYQACGVVMDTNLIYECENEYHNIINGTPWEDEDDEDDDEEDEDDEEFSSSR